MSRSVSSYGFQDICRRWITNQKTSLLHPSVIHVNRLADEHNQIWRNRTNFQYFLHTFRTFFRTSNFFYSSSTGFTKSTSNWHAFALGNEGFTVNIQKSLLRPNSRQPSGKIRRFRPCRHMHKCQDHEFPRASKSRQVVYIVHWEVNSVLMDYTCAHVGQVERHQDTSTLAETRHCPPPSATPYLL